MMKHLDLSEIPNTEEHRSWPLLNRLLLDRTPPSWMRHIIPWRVLYWLDKHTDTCWAGMVMWKEDYEWSWWSCSWQDGLGADGDYCGKWRSKETFMGGERSC